MVLRVRLASDLALCQRKWFLLAVMMLVWLPGRGETSCGQQVYLNSELRQFHRLCHQETFCPKLPSSLPCHGPQCTRAPDSLPHVPVSVSLPRGQQDFVLSEWIILLPGTQGIVIEIVSTIHAIHHVDPPEPPPRHLILG